MLHSRLDSRRTASAASCQCCPRCCGCGAFASALGQHADRLRGLGLAWQKEVVVADCMALVIIALPRPNLRNMSYRV